jgi:O-antigen biosynthesis protein WbqP
MDTHPVRSAQTKTKRLCDLVLGAILSILCAVPMLLIAAAIKLTSSGPVLYWSDRVGKDNTIFRMPKFRTMRQGTPEVATHLLAEPAEYVFPFGSFLRRTSLYELPQLYSILRGDLSFVGPRPALYNQHDLIRLRTENGVHELMPGLTGLAQIMGRDDLPIERKVQYDLEYLRNQSLVLDLKIVMKTFLKVAAQDGVSH